MKELASDHGVDDESACQQYLSEKNQVEIRLTDTTRRNGTTHLTRDCLLNGRIHISFWSLEQMDLLTTDHIPSAERTVS
jgi:hypothetical protein